MAVSITWGDKIINVPRNDLTLIQASPEVRELDINWFRLQLKDLEDSEEGMPFDDTHTHNTEVSLAGLTYARTVEIINGYTVEFEDGQYTINCIGANHNVSDVKISNQVSLIVNNAAGLITNAQIEYASFNGAVTVDLINGTSGTIFPVGTPQRPCNNFEDALQIASFRGFTRLNIQGDALVNNSNDFSNFEIYGESPNKTTLTIDTDADTSGCEFKNAIVTGVLDGENYISDCTIVDLTYVNGSIFNCGLIGDIELDGGLDAVLNDCFTVDQDDPPTIDLGSTGQSLSMPNYSGFISLKNLSDPSKTIGIGVNAGSVTLESTISAGQINISGVGLLTDNSTGTAVVNSEGLMSKETISGAVLDTSLIPFSTSNTVAASLKLGSYGNKVTVCTTDGIPGTAFPAGTIETHVDNIEDAVTIANNIGVEDIHIVGDYTFTSSINISDFNITGNGLQSSTFTFEPGCILLRCKFYDATVTGDSIGSIGYQNCLIFNMGSQSPVPASNKIYVTNCLLKGQTAMPELYTGEFIITDCWGLPYNGIPPTLDMSGGNFDIQFRNYSGFLIVKNCDDAVDFRMMFAGGGVTLDSTVTAGNFIFTGPGTLTDNSTSVTSLDITALVSEGTIATGVWDQPIANHLIPDTTGHQMYDQAYEGIVHIDVINGSSGATFPTGTAHNPCNNLADALSIATTHFIDTIHIIDDLTINGEDITGFTIAADRSLGNTVTITSMVNTGACYFQDLTVSGALSGATRFSTCVLGALTGFDGGANDCMLTGDITITGSGANYFTNCDTYVSSPSISYQKISVGSNMLNIIRCRGAWEIADYTGSLAVTCDWVSAQVHIANTCISGVIVVSGLISLVDDSGAGCYVVDGSINKAGIVDKVWDEATADHAVAGTYGGELATKADIKSSSSTSHVAPTSGAIVEGSSISGTYSSLSVKDNTYWQIQENGTTGLALELTFNIPENDQPGDIQLFGRYEGNPETTHFINLWIYNYESSAWELLVTEFMPGGNTSDDSYTHEVYERNVDRGNNGEIKVRLIHNPTVYNASHNMYLDSVLMGSINIITAADIASAVWADTDALFMLKVIKNKKVIKKTGAVWELIIYDNDDTTPILQKDLKDYNGNNINDIAAGNLAQELQTDV